MGPYSFISSRYSGTTAHFRSHTQQCTTNEWLVVGNNRVLRQYLFFLWWFAGWFCPAQSASNWSCPRSPELHWTPLADFWPLGPWQSQLALSHPSCLRNLDLASYEMLAPVDAELSINSDNTNTVALMTKTAPKFNLRSPRIKTNGFADQRLNYLSLCTTVLPTVVYSKSDTKTVPLYILCKLWKPNLNINLSVFPTVKTTSYWRNRECIGEYKYLGN